MARCPATLTGPGSVGGGLGGALLVAAALATGACVGALGDGAAGETPGSGAAPAVGGPAGASGGPAGPGAGAPATPGSGPAAGAGTAGADPAQPPRPVGACQESPPPVSPVRRLTRDQYNNTVRDLLGDRRSVGNRFPTDDQGDDVFVPTSSLIVTAGWAEQAMNGAEELAQAALATLGTLLPCKPADVGEEPCARQFIESFGKRAYRRPLESGEVARLQRIYALGAGNGGFNHGVELVIRAMLQSPFFLYRLELGQKGGLAGGAVKLTPHEIAARLSYLLWESMPDRALTAAADAGKLATADGIGAEAKRLIADPRARATLVKFHQRWFGLDDLDEVTKDPRKYRDFTGAVLQAMKNESRQFLENVLYRADGRFDTLMTTPVTFVNANMAKLYGVPAPAGETFERVDLDPAQRSGVLTNAAVLTVHTFADESGAIHRGKFVRERFLCQTPPDPPPDLMVVPPVPRAGIPTRDRLAEHSSSPACRPCHQLMDAIGFGFEHYDGIGRWRTTEQGKPVNAAGLITDTLDMNGPFTGVPELARKLVGSAQARGCVVSLALRFAQGPEASGDACARDKMRFAFESAGRDIRELVASVVRTDGFQTRKALAGEVLP